MPQVKVFVSGTYLDIKPYREAVNEQLHRMTFESVDMDYFPTSADDPRTLSLDQLEDCDIYIAIIGHRYGTIPPGETRSITQCEYDRAFERSETDNRRHMRLLIYLADETEVHVPPKLREEDSKHVAQQEFRRLLSVRHTPKVFRNPWELSGWVAADLHRVILEEGLPGKSGSRAKFFSAGDIDVIKGEFDSATQKQVRSVQECLSFVARKFQGMFVIDSSRLLSQPLLQELDGILRQSIPGIALDFNEGTIMRTGVRHVVLRADTFRTLVQHIPQERRHSIGRDIGRGAAHDLTRNTIEKKKLIPKSPDALVELWDYWDRTGGWGTIKLIDTGEAQIAGTEERKSVIKGRAGAPRGVKTGRSAKNPEWRIKLETNSLAISDQLTETHNLAEFWCGYISGFLEIALSRLSSIISELPEPDREHVTIPPYLRVKKVVHVESQSASEDTFIVGFEEEPLSEARRFLVRSQQFLQKEDFMSSMVYARQAIANASVVMGMSPRELIKAVKLQGEDAEALNSMLKAGRFLGLAPRDQVERWFRVANLVIQHLSTAERNDDRR